MLKGKAGSMFACAVVGLLLELSSASAQAQNYEQLVTVADLEKITAAKDVQFVPVPPPNANIVAMLMFMKGGGPFVMVNFAKPGTFVMDRAHPVPGVGDEAFESVDHSTLCFRKGDRPVMITSGFERTAGLNAKKAMWTPEQLRALARTILSRM